MTLTVEELDEMQRAAVAEGLYKTIELIAAARAHLEGEGYEGTMAGERFSDKDYPSPDLVERLRGGENAIYSHHPTPLDIEAATALEALRKENEQLRAERDAWRDGKIRQAKSHLARDADYLRLREALAEIEHYPEHCRSIARAALEEKGDA